jgi:apolipoprotein N-acyltransferase
MTTQLLIVMSMLLFGAVEVEWLLTVTTWAARCRDSPRQPLREHPAALRYDGMPRSATTLVVVEECLVVAAAAGLGLSGGHAHLLSALVLIQLVNMAGRVIESARLRAYAPGLGASLVGLPWCGLTAWALLNEPGLRWSSLLVALVAAMLVLHANYAVTDWLEERVGRRVGGVRAPVG